MIDNTYQGWTNRKTWLVALYFDNDYPIYKRVQSIVKTGGDVKALRFRLETFWRQLSPYDLRDFKDDFRDVRGQEINWEEIATNYASEWAIEQHY